MAVRVRRVIEGWCVRGATSGGGGGFPAEGRVNATKQTGHDGSVAAGTVKKDKLTCDYDRHTAQVALRPAAGSSFGKGDKVKIAVFYFDEDGFSYARQETAVVL
ncbi:hypothetical protein ACWDBF_02135 [Streptomyces angustmyceticus]